MEAHNDAGGQHGYWTRDAVVAMDNRALARMLFEYPEHAPRELLKAVGIVKEKIVEISTAPSADAVLEDIFDKCTALDDEDIEAAVARADTARMSMATARTIRRAVAEKHNLTVCDLDSECRTKRLVRARHEAMFMVVGATILSFPRIGRIFGNRDHTTVMAGVRRHAKRNNLKAPRGL